MLGALALRRGAGRWAARVAVGGCKVTIYVDAVTTWPTSIRCFKGGSCHMFTDGTAEELHAFASKLGLRRGWFQRHQLLPHYDLTPARRAKAIALGAVEVSLREYLRAKRAADEQVKP